MLEWPNPIVKLNLTGDSPERYLGLARSMMFKLKMLMDVGGLNQFQLSTSTEDGSFINVQSVFGQDFVNIVTPVSVPVKRTKEIIPYIYVEEKYGDPQPTKEPIFPALGIFDGFGNKPWHTDGTITWSGGLKKIYTVWSTAPYYAEIDIPSNTGVSVFIVDTQLLGSEKLAPLGGGQYSLYGWSIVYEIPYPHQSWTGYLYSGNESSLNGTYVFGSYTVSGKEGTYTINGKWTSTLQESPYTITGSTKKNIYGENVYDVNWKGDKNPGTKGREHTLTYTINVLGKPPDVFLDEWVYTGEVINGIPMRGTVSNYWKQTTSFYKYMIQESVLAGMLFSLVNNQPFTRDDPSVF